MKPVFILKVWVEEDHWIFKEGLTQIGDGCGIQTHETLTSLTVFKTVRFVHSRNPPAIVLINPRPPHPHPASGSDL